MQLNIANPLTGCQKQYRIEEDSKLRTLYDKRLSAEVEGENLGEEFKGYTFKIMGGQDKQGFPPIPGLTDTEVPKMRGPKRASKIRKLFNLTKEDDVRKYVNIYRREWEKDGKKRSRAPKIQRLVTPQTVQRKRHIRSLKTAKIAKSKAEAAEYHKLLQLRLKEARERRSESLAKKRALRSSSQA